MPARRKGRLPRSLRSQWRRSSAISNNCSDAGGHRLPKVIPVSASHQKSGTRCRLVVAIASPSRHEPTRIRLAVVSRAGHTGQCSQHQPGHDVLDARSGLRLPAAPGHGYQHECALLLLPGVLHKKMGSPMCAFVFRISAAHLQAKTGFLLRRDYSALLRVLWRLFALVG
jgi:hypothetical protein